MSNDGLNHSSCNLSQADCWSPSVSTKDYQIQRLQTSPLASDPSSLTPSQLLSARSSVPVRCVPSSPPNDNSFF